MSKSSSNLRFVPAALLFFWTLSVLPFAKPAHDKAFQYFLMIPGGEKFYHLPALIIVILIGLASPIIWIFLAWIFPDRSTSLSVSGFLSHLFLAVAVFASPMLDQEMWLFGPDTSIFALLGLVIFAGVIIWLIIAGVFCIATIQVTSYLKRNRLSRKS